MFSRAYKRLIRKEGEELSLPGLQYTPRQLFWISSAELYCKVARDNQMINTILTDYHAPYRYFYTYNFGKKSLFLVVFPLFHPCSVLCVLGQEQY